MAYPADELDLSPPSTFWRRTRRLWNGLSASRSCGHRTIRSSPSRVPVTCGLSTSAFGTSCAQSG
eukprot:scaffold115108_cov28-Tisochrysis_lutea.AAC.3